jgi:hypothetical protein
MILARRIGQAGFLNTVLESFSIFRRVIRALSMSFNGLLVTLTARQLGSYTRNSEPESQRNRLRIVQVTKKQLSIAFIAYLSSRVQ